MEEWQDIDGYGGRFQVSSMGRVRNTVTGRLIGSPDKQGYIHASILNTAPTIHSLVAKAFLPPPPPSLKHPEIDHLDGNKANNRRENLEWVTHSENRRRAIRRGAPPPPRRDVRGEANASAVLTEEQVRWILSHPKKYGVGTKLAAELGVSAGLVQSILRRERWAHLSE